MTETHSILVVDDEQAIRRLLCATLRRAGYDPVEAGDARAALSLAQTVRPAAALVDLGLPDRDGLELIQSLSRGGACPVLVVSARDAAAEKIAALDLGADDYVTKPFSPRELVLRVKALLRRRVPTEPEAENFDFADLKIDIPRHEVSVCGQRVDLTATEFKLLTVLAERRGRVQSREALLRDVWEYDNFIDTRTVDTHMRRLRDKLGKAASHLDTVRGVGYRFVDKV